MHCYNYETEWGKFWFKGDLYHREDGPAVESKNGYKSWFKNGIRHREDGPAIEDGDRKMWYLDGKPYSEENYNRVVKLLFLL